MKNNKEIGYKAFKKGLICKGKQYKENTVYKENGNEICQAGIMHYCENPFNVLNFYPLVDKNDEITEFAEVEPLGKVYNCKFKSATNKLRIGTKLELPGFIDACINFALKHTDVHENKKKFEQCSNKIIIEDFSDINSNKYNDHIDGNGYSARITSSGRGSRITSNGNNVQITSNGDNTQIVSNGYSAQISSNENDTRIISSGDSTYISSNGCESQIASSGNCARITSNGYNTQIASSGNYANIASNGCEAKIVSNGYSTHIASNGLDSQIASSGNNARINSNGNSAQIISIGKNTFIASSGINTRIVSSGCGARIISSGIDTHITSSGERSSVIAIGPDSIAKAKIGSSITLAELEEEESADSDGDTIWNIKCVKTEYVDGEHIKENVFYKLENGEFVEVK